MTSPQLTQASERNRSEAEVRHARRNFSADEIRVIRERFHGWEKADCKTLAAIFETTPQRISRIVHSDVLEAIATGGLR